MRNELSYSGYPPWEARVLWCLWCDWISGLLLLDVGFEPPEQGSKASSAAWDPSSESEWQMSGNSWNGKEPAAGPTQCGSELICRKWIISFQCVTLSVNGTSWQEVKRKCSIRTWLSELWGRCACLENLEWMDWSKLWSLVQAGSQHHKAIH